MAMARTPRARQSAGRPRAPMPEPSEAGKRAIRAALAGLDVRLEAAD